MLHTGVVDSTRRDPRIERTHRVVLDAAIEVIAEHGFAGTTIDAIASRSGVARSTIYRNWNGRTELMLEAVRARVGPVPGLVVARCVVIWSPCVATSRSCLRTSRWRRLPPR